MLSYVASQAEEKDDARVLIIACMHYRMLHGQATKRRPGPFQVSRRDTCPPPPEGTNKRYITSILTVFTVLYRTSIL